MGEEKVGFNVMSFWLEQYIVDDFDFHLGADEVWFYDLSLTLYKVH
ncbi:MAG: hypothetical protein U5K77_00530 [Candidatus Saccharibacteria bacterium]|nr:hypothetical protein [Candidatus Saccharibacteria bacterium]